ncbi:hypothetical protein H0A61_02693 [Koleobacter methoxysyntrophicus]|jgi:hypothetical protein|uniref:Uncharacterized protein n=1 Tax=Koleobacter methoxysyntrophicus TaxID=2751313 RepID=A0A8A0RQW7_9FIRM|nr:hypothetical protein [Koleobacter methoxysyntrophicus]QSQ10292.1 hypothetical protein H0A61_02693 [Koleobacter methoxysyntrophicus]
MSKDRINERIIKGLKKCSEDEDIINFLIELFYEETEHAGSWWWKDVYRKKIILYSESWGENCENKENCSKELPSV